MVKKASLLLEILSSLHLIAAVSSSGGSNIEVIDISPQLPASKTKEFYNSWEESFPASSSPLFTYNAKTDPERALEAAHDAFRFVSQWLPSSVIAKLSSFPYKKSGPSAILIRVFPIDKDVPSTPIKKTSVFDDSTDGSVDKPTLVPVAECWLLGVSRILGIPFCAPGSLGVRGGLVRDITQNENDIDDLPMHPIPNWT